MWDNASDEEKGRERAGNRPRAHCWQVQERFASGLLSFSVEMVLSMVVHKMSQETAQASLYCLVSVADLWFENAWPKFLKRKPNSSLQPVWEIL